MATKMMRCVLFLLLFHVQDCELKSKILTSEGEDLVEKVAEKSKILTTEGEDLVDKVAEKKYSKLVAVSVQDGVNLGLKQCRELFKFSTWNCTIELRKEPMSKLPDILNKNIPVTRETAFLNSIIAAGVMYALTRDCRQKKLKECSAHNHPIYKNIPGGCSKDIKFGEVMAKPFLDVKGTGKNQLILHNNEVGRKEVRRSFRMYCYCHGATTSCMMRTCWPQLSPFKEIGESLKEKYKNAMPVLLIKNKLQYIYKEPVVANDPNLFFTDWPWWSTPVSHLIKTP